MADSLLTAPKGQPAPDLSTQKVSFVDPNGPKAIVKSATPASPTTTIAPPPAPENTMDAGAISENKGSTINFPDNVPTHDKSASDANTANVSVPSPIPTAESIINTDKPPSPAETKQKSILDRIAALTLGNKGQQQLTNESESAAGVPALTKTTNDLSVQLQGLNDQATALQNEALYTIPNQVQLDNKGTGVTKASTTARSADALRVNQIKQGEVATQALTLKAAYYAANGNLTLAKDAADKAATAEFQQQQNEIDYQKALLDANAPLFKKEGDKEALLEKTKLDDRQRELDQQKNERKNISDVMITAAKYGADSATLKRISESNTYDEAITNAGNAIVDPKAQYDLQSAKLDNVLKQAQIDKVKKETSLLGEPTAAERKATADALKSAQASIPAMQDKITAVDTLVKHPGLAGAVGPNIFTRLAPFSSLTGSARDFAGGIHKLVGGLTLQNLIDAKARGATFGALSEGELSLLASSATAINDWEIKDAKGNGTGKWNIDEASFKREMDNIKTLTQRAIQQSGQSLITPEEQKVLDAVSVPTQPINAASYF